MAYIFMDESGDLGFNLDKKGTSHNFIITFLFTTNNRQVEKAVKKAFTRLPSKIRSSHPGCLHATKERPKTRRYLLSELAKLNLKVITISLNKNRVYTHLADEKHILYNYITNILLDRLYTKKIIPTDQSIKLVISQRETNRFLNQNFSNYLLEQSQNNHKIKLDISIQPSHSSKALQAVDFICWSIFRKYEHRDASYYNIIKSKIIEERGLFRQ